MNQQQVPRYAYGILGILLLANCFNYADRQIIAIVAHAMQRDLGFTDAQLGFLMGTAFAAFYGVFGIGMGRIADAVSRPRLLAVGFALWSVMTVASGLAWNFIGLALARMGVGIGEAAGTPCAHSLLSESFPARNRAAAIGTYLLGPYLGGAAAFILGGYCLGHWPEVCTRLGARACLIADWQAAFLLVGVPGLLIALLVAFLPETRRRRAPDLLGTAQWVIREISSAIPPFAAIRLATVGGWRAMRGNLVIGVLLAGFAVALGWGTGDWSQWIAISLGSYAVLTWAQLVRWVDPSLHRLTFGCRTFVLMLLAATFMGILNITVTAWAAPYALRALHAQPGELGAQLGAAGLSAAVLSTVLGGWWVDRWKRVDPRAPVWISLMSLMGSAGPLLLMLYTSKLSTFATAYFAFNLSAMAWSAGFAAMAQDLVLPHMRGSAAAILSLVVILLSAGLGPYWVGKISTVTGSLGTGLLSVLAVIPLAMVVLFPLAKCLSRQACDSRHAPAVGPVPDCKPPAKLGA